MRTLGCGGIAPAASQRYDRLPSRHPEERRMKPLVAAVAVLVAFAAGAPVQARPFGVA